MKALALGVLFLFAAVAQAKTTKELKAVCSPGADKKQPGSSLLCLGYIEGAAEAISSRPTVLADEWVVLTFNEPYTIGQLKDAFLLFLNEYPAQEQNPALDVLLGSWMMRNMLKSTPSLVTRPGPKAKCLPYSAGLFLHNPHCAKPVDQKWCMKPTNQRT